MIRIDDLMRRLLASALDDNTPCLVGTASRDGTPQISPKGSVAVYDDETLCFWERSHRTARAHIAENPKVVVYYRNYGRAAEMPYRSGALRFHGIARIAEFGPERNRVWDLTNAFEQSRDPDRKGVAVLISVDRIEELTGAIVMRRD